MVKQQLIAPQYIWNCIDGPISKGDLLSAFKVATTALDRFFIEENSEELAAVLEDGARLLMVSAGEDINQEMIEEAVNAFFLSARNVHEGGTHPHGEKVSGE